jgi:hypothetical protein
MLYTWWAHLRYSTDGSTAYGGLTCGTVQTAVLHMVGSLAVQYRRQFCVKDELFKASSTAVFCTCLEACLSHLTAADINLRFHLLVSFKWCW